MELTIVQRVHQEYLKTRPNALRYPYSLTFNKSVGNKNQPITIDGFVFARNKIEANNVVDTISKNYAYSLSNNGNDNWYGAKMQYSSSKKQKYAQAFGTVFGVRSLATNIKKGFNVGGLTPFSLFKLVNLNIKSSVSNYFGHREQNQLLDNNKKSKAFLLFLLCLIASAISFFGLIAIALFSSSIFSFYSYILIVVGVLGASIVSALWALIWPKMDDNQNE